MSLLTLACRDSAHPAIPIAPGVVAVDDLCVRPGRLAEFVEGADRLVLVLHEREYTIGQIQKHCRSAGFDPIGVQVVHAGDIDGDARRLSVLLAGAKARSENHVEAEPDQLRPVLSTTLSQHTMSRRALLSLPQTVYEAVPRIDPDVCAADDGCQACVGVCPVDAYQWVNGSVLFDKAACVTCGQCVTVCPTGAVDNPTVSSDGIAAQISAIVQASVDPVGIAFVCRRRSEPLTVPGWFPIEVPCTAMVPATWLLASLSLGSAAASSVPCSALGCPLGLDNRSAETLGLARDLASAVGLDHGAIAVEPGELPEMSSAVPTGLSDPFGVHGPAAVVSAFAGGGDGDSIRLEAPGAPMGVVEIDTSSCTMCTMCTSTCPTGALQVGGTPERVEITFDAGLCTGCQQCVPRCPERERGAITLHQVIDVAALRTGRVTLARGDTLTCERCGDPVAPNAMLDRIAAILGDEYSETMSYVSRRCLNCRGS